MRAAFVFLAGLGLASAFAAEHGDLRGGVNVGMTAADLPALLNAMTAVESGLPDSAVRRNAGPTPSASARGSVDRTGGNVTNVTVGKIEVTSSRADPAAVADQVAGAIQRKASVAQANTGQT